jgi:hypothetical protein
MKPTNILCGHNAKLLMVKGGGTCICMYVRMHIYIYVCVCVYVCVCARVCVCMYVRTYVLFVYVRTCVCVCVCVCMYVRMCVYVCSLFKDTFSVTQTIQRGIKG